ncbi:MAG TPA: tetratricopeptide repeat protein [Thermoanaerobaculia bacterium]|nr:tetratricopeptide repeat protein [Thermoanaerobaculia bacterium]
MKKRQKSESALRVTNPSPDSRARLSEVNRPAFLLACLAAFVLLFAAYANHFDNSFHFDDSHVIQNNLYIHSLSNIPLFFTDARTFSSLPANATYRPLLTLSYAIDYRLGNGLDPRQFHITQFALLAILGVMLVFFFKRCMDNARPASHNIWIALVASTWFCVHTANTETMNLLSSRSDLVSTMAIVASFLLFFYLPRLRRLFVHAVPMVIGALAKAPAVFFTPLLLVYLLLFDREEVPGSSDPKMRRRAVWLHVTPLLAISIVLLWFLSAMNLPEWQSGGGDRLVYLRTQAYVWLHYARLFFLPVGLTADTDLAPATEWYDTRMFAGLLFIGLLALIYRRTSRNLELKPVAFGIAWFAIGLFPTSSIFPLAEYANEHRIFLPYIGLCLATTWWVAVRAEEWGRQRRHLPASRWLIASLAILILAGNAIGTHYRNEVWKSEETLWLDVTRKSPNNGRALMNYGLTRMARGEYQEARSLFESAKRINPNYWTLEINLGIVHGALNDHVEAEQHFLRAVELDPGANAQRYYSDWLVRRGRAPEAVPRLRRAIELSPATAASRETLMRIFAATGSEAELRALAEDTARIAPSNELAQTYLDGRFPVRGNDFTQLLAESATAIGVGNMLDGAQAARAALEIQPDSADARNNLGWALANLGFLREGIAELERAARLDPSSALIRANLAWAVDRARESADESGA